MSTDDTDGVLAAIDGALADWSLSGDAMRWTPDPAQSLLEAATTPHPLAVRMARLNDVLMTDMMLFGHAYVDDHGNRVPPERVLTDASGVMRGFSAHFTIMNERALSRTRESMAQMARDVTAVCEGWVPVIEKFNTALAGLRVAEPLDPRERALQARRNRNTGPARTPYQKRGIT